MSGVLSWGFGVVLTLLSVSYPPTVWTEVVLVEDEIEEIKTRQLILYVKLTLLEALFFQLYIEYKLGTYWNHKHLDSQWKNLNYHSVDLKHNPETVLKR